MFFFCFKEVRAIAEIDSLEIKISASAEQANKAIRNLTRSLGALSSSLKFDTSSLEKLGKINGNNFKKIGEGLQSFANAARSLQGVDGNNFDKLSQGLSKIASIDPSKLEALGKIDGNSFRGLGEGVKALSAGLKDLKGVSTKKFETLATGIERLGAIQVGNMQTVASALTPLADGIRTLSSASFDNRNLQNLINSLTRLSNANVGSLATVDFTTFGNNIKGLATALSGADKVEQNTIAMTNAIAKLAGAGANISTVTTELPRLGTALKDFMNTMSGAPILASETIAFTQAIGQLANAGSKAETVANNLKHLGDELKRFMQTMASAPNVSLNVIQMTQALAQLANAGGGTGRAASSLGNAFNGTSVAAIRLSSNTNILSVSLKGLGTRLNRTLKGVKSFTSQLLAAAGIMGGIYGIIRGGLKSMDIASSLTEVQNVVDTTFGDMSDKVQEFADNSIRQFGMSELSVKQFASRFQAMGTAMGIPTSLIKSSNEFLNSQTNGYVGLSDSMSDVSLNLTKLTADIASFYDVEQKEVAEDLAAIYTGMTVPLRKYGLDLTQATLKEWAMKNGLDANIKSMSQAEKTMLRYQYVLANTTAAQGDFLKTADTWANQVRILKQNFEQLGSVIGTSLINAFKPLVQTLNNVLQYVIAFAEKVTEALGTIFGWKYESGGAGGIVQDWSDIADTTGEAADNIDKMKKGLRAFDELNNITSPDKSGGGAGAGGAGEGAGGGIVKTDAIWEKYKSDIDTLGKLGKYIGDTLSKAMEDIDWDSIYQKARDFGRGLAEFLNGLISPRLFENIGKTIAGALNTALHFLDSFGLWFNWKNFGDSLAAGLLGFLNNIQWDVALSAAKNWGKGIADTLNHFISPETFSATGNAIAMALNTAVQFALSFGENFNFKNLGESIAAGINDFFATFNFKDLAATLNIWAKGILDAVITALDETDWDLIGSQIGEFLADIDLWAIGGKVGKALWKAINAGIKTFASSFSKAPVKTTLITLVAIPKALKAITDTKLIKGIQNLVKYFGKLASTAKLAITALAGNVASLSTLMTQFPRFGSMVSVATQAFAEFRSGLSSQGFGTGLSQGLATLNNGITNFRNSLSGLQKGVITAVAGFAEFTIISDVFEGLTLGSENLIAGIGKIGAAAGIAAAAMYTAFGPAGVAVAAITGLVAAAKGIGDALDQIRAEEIGNAIRDAMSAPGGTPISDIVSQFASEVGKIGNSFTIITEKASGLKQADSHIRNTWLEIERIETSMDAGVLSVEEGTKKLNEVFASLAQTASEKFGELEITLIAAFGESGVLNEVFNRLGISTENTTSTIIQLNDKVEQRIKELTKLLAETDPSNPNYAKYREELATLTANTDETRAALEKYDSALKQIDYSNLIGADGNVDTDELERVLKQISDATTDAQKDVTSAIDGIRESLSVELKNALTIGDYASAEEINSKLSALEEALSLLNDGIASRAKEITDTMQIDFIDKTNGIIDTSISEWEQKGVGEQAFRALFGKSSTEGEYVKEAVDRQKANIATISDAVEGELKQFGINGAGWSKQYTEEAFAPLFSTEQTNYGANVPVFTQKLNEDYRSILESAAQSAYEYATPVGDNMMFGTRDGVDRSKPDMTTSVGNAIQAMIDVAKEVLDEHSPSKVFEEIGEFAIQGLSNGIDALKDNPITEMGNLLRDMISKFDFGESDFWNIGHNIMQGLFDGIASMAESIFSKVQEIGQGVSNAIKGILDIHSPSRVMYQLGDYTMQGFQNGLENLYQPIISSLKEFGADLQLAPSFETGRFDIAPPPEFDFDARQRGAYQIAAEIQRENSRAYSNSDGYDNYSEEASLLMSQNQLLKRQNELLEQLVKKEFGISKSDIGKAARDYSIEYFNRTGNPAYQF